MATIAENLQSLVTCKNDIATAITNKGIILPENAGFRNFASAIDSIETSSLPSYGISSLYYTGSVGSNFDRSERTTTFPSSYSFSKNTFYITCDSIYNNSYGDGSKKVIICSPSNANLNALSLYCYANNDITTLNVSTIKNKKITIKFKMIESSGTVKFSNRYYSVNCNFGVSARYHSSLTYSDLSRISLGACYFNKTSSYSEDRTVNFGYFNGQSITGTVTIPSISTVWDNVLYVSAYVSIYIDYSSSYGYLYPQSITPISIKMQIDIQSIE